MPFSREFERLQKKCLREEKDYASGLTKAFKFAFEKGVNPIDQKRNKKNPKDKNRFHI